MGLADTLFAVAYSAPFIYNSIVCRQNIAFLSELLAANVQTNAYHGILYTIMIYSPSY
jgi:hypothetical protein